MKKKLIDIDSLKNLHPHKISIPELSRDDPEIAEWLNKIFELKEAEQISLSFRKIAEELSKFLGRSVEGRQINDAYYLWQKRK